MRDIENRAAIDQVIAKFYDQLLMDPLLSDLFEREVKADLEAHLVKISDFWEFNLLGTKEYKNNMFAAHIGVHNRWNLNQKKFDRWLDLFCQTIDNLFKGENAERMKTNARGIAAVMISKFQGTQFFNKKSN